MTDQCGFAESSCRTLSDDFLQMAMKRAMGSFKRMRAEAVAGLDDYQQLSDRCRWAKDRVLANLDVYLEQLEASVQRTGGKVFWAETGDDVIEYILRLARDKNLTNVVKGKSMTSEEIELNPALIKAGLDVMETDLGEYIIQLTGERPSHLIGPAIHMCKEEIARLFQERIGLEYTEDPPVMTQAVRRVLRAKFLQADLGITGANFTVAETGTVVLLENEGNIRMSTTLPRVHVAIMGLEKIVADTADLTATLRMLPVSAVGQRLPSYVSLLNGPGRVQGEGPEEFHLILLDGFRTKVLADPDFRQVLRCIRCAACLNYCPVYNRLAGHCWPWVYSGPIGTVLTGAAKGVEEAKDVVEASTLCRACGQVCPMQIDLPGLILKLRERLAVKRPVQGLGMDVLGRMMASPKGYELCGGLLATGAGVMIDAEGRVRFGPDKLKAMGRDRVLPRPGPGFRNLPADFAPEEDDQ